MPRASLQLPPAGVLGNFVAVSSEFTQPCKEDAVLPREVWSLCVGLSGWHQSRFLSKESKAQSSHFFSSVCLQNGGCFSLEVHGNRWLDLKNISEKL